MSDNGDLSRQYLDVAGVLIVALDPSGKVTLINKKGCEILGLKQEEIIGKHWFNEFVPEKPRRDVKNTFAKLMRGELEPAQYYQNAILAKGGEEKMIFWHNALLRDANGAIIGTLSSGMDVTEQEKVKQAFRESEARFRTAIESLPFDFFVINKRGEYSMVNAVCRQNWGDIIGRKPEDVAKDPSALAIWKENNKKAFSGHVVEGEATFTVKGKEKVFYNIISPIYESGQINGILGINIDITDRKKAEQKLEILNKHLIETNRKLESLALKDYHTGLYNYRYLTDVIESELYRSKRHATPLSVIMIDIDYFKSVNELYGSDYGDLVIKQLSAQLTKSVRRYDAVMRSGGEEFAIICPFTDKKPALTLARRMLNSVTVYNFGTKDQTIKLKLSIGVATFPDVRVVKGIGLVNEAMKALEKAKDSGGNRIYYVKDVEKKASKEEGRSQADVFSLRKKIEKLTKETNQNLVEAIFAFAKTIELKDHYTGEHVEKTVYYATELARRLDMSPEEVERIRQAAVLHDLGKIGISDKILLKKSKLTKKEFDTIKKHPQIAADILRPIQVLHDIIPYIFYHHERWDGSGYPSGLKEEEIPLGARIIAMADVYQALSSDRPYRKAYTRAKIRKIIKESAGTQFDPKIVRIFLEILKKEK